jgi:hypothetical protein
VELPSPPGLRRTSFEGIRVNETEHRDGPEPEGGLIVFLWLLAALTAEVDVILWFFDRVYSA